MDQLTNKLLASYVYTTCTVCTYILHTYIYMYMYNVQLCSYSSYKIHLNFTPMITNCIAGILQGRKLTNFMIFVPSAKVFAMNFWGKHMYKAPISCVYITYTHVHTCMVVHAQCIHAIYVRQIAIHEVFSTKCIFFHKFVKVLSLKDSHYMISCSVSTVIHVCKQVLTDTHLT